MCYIFGNKPSTLDKFWYSMHHTIFCSHKKFHLFFFIRTGSTKMDAPKNQQDRSSTLEPERLTSYGHFEECFYSKNSPRFLPTVVWILFFDPLRMTVPFATAHLDIIHCTHHPVIYKSDLYLN